MRFQSMSADKPDFIAFPVRASAAIGAGQLCVLEFDGTEDGLSVALPAAAGATKFYSSLFGVATGAIASGTLGEVIAFGFCRKTRLRTNTRAASSDDWSTKPSAAQNVVLLVDSVNGCFSTAASGDVSTIAATHLLPFAILAESVAAHASSAASDYTTDTRTAITTLVKAFLRLM